MRIRLGEALFLLLAVCFIGSLFHGASSHRIGGAELVGVLIMLLAGGLSLLGGIGRR